jgi:hypothetical protein
MMGPVRLRSHNGVWRARGNLSHAGLAAVVLAIAGWAGTACAQDDEIVEDVPAGAQEQQQFMVAEENFNQWVFGGQGSAGGQQKRFESMLHVQVEGVGRSCTLTDEQKKKLTLAGAADIKRFFERVAVLKKKFDLVKNDQNKFNQFWQDVQPIQAIVNRGTFGEGSYFKKTLKSVLNSEQVANFDKADRERRLFNYRAKVETVVCNMDEVLSLRAEQRQKLVELLTTPQQVPRTFGQESYGQYAVLYQASRIPEDKLKQILDKPQLITIQRVLNMARGYGQFLKTGGYTWDGDADPGPGDPANVDVNVEANAIFEEAAP